jgi:hypothetical protein
MAADGNAEFRVGRERPASEAGKGDKKVFIHKSDPE